MPRTTAALTAEQARERIQAQGITITEWATAHGWNRQDVYDVLNGVKKGRFGRAHEIAVALGMKSTPAGEIGNPQKREAA